MDIAVLQCRCMVFNSKLQCNFWDVLFDNWSVVWYFDVTAQFQQQLSRWTWISQMTLSFVLCTSLRYIRSTSIILITNQFCNLASLPVIPFDVSRWVCPLVLWVVFYSSHILISTAIIPRARESSVTHKSAITDHAVEENHVIDWDKAKVVDRGTAIDQMDKRGTLDQEDTDVYESGCRILPTQPHVGQRN